MWSSLKLELQSGWLAFRLKTYAISIDLEGDGQHDYTEPQYEALTALMKDDCQVKCSYLSVSLEMSIEWIALRREDEHVKRCSVYWCVSHIVQLQQFSLSVYGFPRLTSAANCILLVPEHGDSSLFENTNAEPTLARSYIFSYRLNASDAT